MFSSDEAREHDREPRDVGRRCERDREEPCVSGAGASATARSHACRTQVQARRIRPCDVGRGREARYSWNSAMAAKGSQNTKITTNGQRWALLTATYSRMNAVGQK